MLKRRKISDLRKDLEAVREGWFCEVFDSAHLVCHTLPVLHRNTANHP
jgi:hypothetical protein